MTPSTGVWEVMSTEVFSAYTPQDRGTGIVKRIIMVRDRKFRAVVELEITSFSPGSALFEYESESASDSDNCEVFMLSERQYGILRQAIISALAVISESDGGLPHHCWSSCLNEATREYDSLAITTAGGKKRRKRN